LYQKRPPQTLIRLPNSSSAVASDTTLGLLARNTTSRSRRVYGILQMKLTADHLKDAAVD
jgi:hypothetical protein